MLKPQLFIIIIIHNEMKKTLLIFSILAFQVVFAQQKDVKVGLVLSGGGAKGLAHIGAIKAIEEAGVRIDYIGGTSMGAIIGSLYASGYSSEELDSIVRSTNFNILIQDEIPRRAMTFYEKESVDRYAISLPFDNFKLGFPTGLSKGQNIYNLMSGLTVHLDNETDFSKLPIPFFCVATDVETGQEVILDKGSLANAVAASGAIPTVFAPVKIDNRLLIDGGVVNNYPIEELKKRGADVVIGVDVQDSLLTRKKLKGVFDILTQVTNFRTIKDMKSKIPKTDVYIRPNIDNFSIFSFEEASSIIKAGEEAAIPKLPILKALAARQKTSGTKYIRPEVDSVYISEIAISGNNTYPRAYVLGRLRLNYPEKYAVSSLNTAINSLSASGNFDKINYSLVKAEKDKEAYKLQVNLKEGENKTFLKFGIHYDELYRSAALLNLTKKSTLFANDAASLDLIVGENLRYNFQYYIDKGYYWSIGINSRFNKFDKSINYDLIKNELESPISDINRIDVDYKDFTNQFYVETLFNQAASFGIGAEHKYLKISSETINDRENDVDVPGTNFTNAHYYSGFAYLKFDTFDDFYFPSHGLFFNARFNAYPFASGIDNFSEFSILKAKAGYAITPFSKFSVRFFYETGLNIGLKEDTSFDYFLGGYGNNFINNIVPFYGYDFFSLGGESYAKALLDVDLEIFPKNHFVFSANYANVEDDLYSNGNWLSMPDYSGYAIGYGIETILGPLEVKYSYSPQIKRSQWFFSLGFWF